MNIKNLNNGQIIKNYKQLCVLLDEPIKGGKSKVYQILDFERYFKYHKEGNKFIIEEVYNMPKPKENNIVKGNNNKYIDLIKDILIEYLYKNCKNDGKVLLSFSKLINILGLVNNTYSVANMRKRELSDVLKIELKAVYYFYNNTRSEFKNIVERALKNLERRSVIFYNKKMMIVEKTHIYDEITNKPILKYREAEEDEIRMILDAQKGALEYLGFEDFQALFLAGNAKYKEFMKLVNLELPKEWQFFFSVYELYVGEKAIQIEYNHMKERKTELNNKLTERARQLLKVVNETDSEQILIDKLINLNNYDRLLDEELIELYKKKEEEKTNKINNNKNILYKIENEKQDVLMDIEVTKNLYEQRDAISKYELIEYSNSRKNKKGHKNHNEDFDFLFI